MTLDQAIERAEEVAELQEKMAKEWNESWVRKYDVSRCKECAEEHRQLAEWLKELKHLRNLVAYSTDFHCTIKEAEKELQVAERNLCDSCINNGCILQSGIVRSHCDFYKVKLNFDIDKVKEFLKRDDFCDLIVDHTCEQTRYKKMIDDIDFAIEATDTQDDYSMGMRNGMRYVKSLIDGKEPRYESRRTEEEIKLGDEVVGDYGSKGVVVGIDTYKGCIWLSLLMENHKVPQLVKASGYKTKTGRHFPQIVEVLNQMKGESDGK